MLWSDELAQQVKMFEAVSNNVNSNPRRHVMEEMNLLLQINFWTPQAGCGACTHSTHIDEAKK